MHEVLVDRLGGLSLPRKSVVRLTDRPDMTLDVYRGRKTTTQQQQTLANKKETLPVKLADTPTNSLNHIHEDLTIHFNAFDAILTREIT